jgi:hypothetical protein
MNLQTLFEKELSSVGTGGATTIHVSSAKSDLTCEVTERNSLAVSFNILRLSTPELAGAETTDLERIGKTLADRLTYLMEPISPVEIDAQGCVVQLRSNPPQRDDDGRTYFELLVRRGGEIALTRYRKENGEARQPVAATVTREVLLRLVGDFSAVLE